MDKHIRDLVEKTPLVDTHEHLLEEETRLAGIPDARRGAHELEMLPDVRPEVPDCPGAQRFHRRPKPEDVLLPERGRGMLEHAITDRRTAVRCASLLDLRYGSHAGSDSTPSSRAPRSSMALRVHRPPGPRVPSCPHAAMMDAPRAARQRTCMPAAFSQPAKRSVSSGVGARPIGAVPGL
jgi:hypothetical protein